MARTFDGTTAYLQYSTTPVVTAYPMSLSAWIKLGATAATYIINGLSSQTVANTILLTDWQTSGKIHAAAGTNEAITAAGFSDTTTWHHIVGVFASTTSRSAYFDGNNLATNSGSFAFPASLFQTIGAYFNGTTTAVLFFNGSIAFPAIWNTALTTNDILNLFHKLSPTKVESANLVSYALLTGASPEADSVAAGTWTVNGTSNNTADPFTPLNSLSGVIVTDPFGVHGFL